MVVQGLVNDVRVYGPKQGPHDEFWSAVLTVDGEKYSMNINQATIGVNTGDTVAFMFKTNGQYKNIDKKSFNIVSRAAPRPAQSAAANRPAPSSQGNVNYGVACGHAINCAVSLAAGAGTDDIGFIEQKAIEIYQLSMKMQSDAAAGKYDAVVTTDRDNGPDRDADPGFQDDDLPF